MKLTINYVLQNKIKLIPYNDISYLTIWHIPITSESMTLAWNVSYFNNRPSVLFILSAIIWGTRQVWCQMIQTTSTIWINILRIPMAVWGGSELRKTSFVFLRMKSKIYFWDRYFIFIRLCSIDQVVQLYCGSNIR